jgi:hypothetical protein
MRAGIVGTGLSVAHTRLTYADRADAGHHFALGQMAVADDAGSSVVGLERRMPSEELGHFGLDRLREEIARPTAQDFGELPLVESTGQRYRSTRHIAPSVEK